MTSLEVPGSTTINQLIEQLDLPRNLVHLVLLNGIFIAEQDRDQQMSAGDTLAIWPPVAGG